MRYWAAGCVFHLCWIKHLSRVRVDDLADLQHAQHDVQSGLRSQDGHVARYPIFSDPRSACVGSVLFVLAPVLATGAFCLFERACMVRHLQ